MKKGDFLCRGLPFYIGYRLLSILYKNTKTFVTNKQKNSKLSVIITIAYCFIFLYSKNDNGKIVLPKPTYEIGLVS